MCVSQTPLMLETAEHYRMKGKWGFRILSDSQSTQQIKQVRLIDFKLDWSQTDHVH